MEYKQTLNTEKFIDSIDTQIREAGYREFLVVIKDEPSFQDEGKTYVRGHQSPHSFEAFLVRIGEQDLLRKAINRAQKKLYKLLHDKKHNGTIDT